MSGGVGLDVSVGFALETTAGTRVAPDTFFEVRNENLTGEQTILPRKGMGGGRGMVRGKRLGNRNVGGGINMDLRAAGMADLLRLILGGDPTPSGADPYTRVFAGGADLPTATWQIQRAFSPTQIATFDYTGCMANGWSITQNPGDYADFQLDLLGREVVTDQTAATFAPPAALGIFTFEDLTVTTPDGAGEFDSVTIAGSNTIEAAFKVGGGTPGRAKTRRNGMTAVTGTLAGDFDNLDAYSRHLAGTEGTLTLAYSLGASQSLKFEMNIVYMEGNSPQVAGEGVVKQGIPFMALSDTDDATALTVTLVNEEA